MLPGTWTFRATKKQDGQGELAGDRRSHGDPAGGDRATERAIDKVGVTLEEARAEASGLVAVEEDAATASVR